MGVPDRGPMIVGVTWSLTFLCGAFLALRLYAKLSRRQGLWWDDHTLIFSWILLFVEAVLTHISRSMGFGKRTTDIPAQNLMTLAMYGSIAATISCFASTFSKISFGITLLRITQGRVRWFVWFCISTLFLIMIPSAVGLWIQCRPIQKTWDDRIPGTCVEAKNQIGYAIFNAAWCAVADFALALLPWYLIWDLQLNRKEKLGVGIAMSIGVLSGVCAIVKGIYVIQLRQLDFSYNGKDVTIWTAVETSTAIIAASIPVLRVFFKEKASSYHRSQSRGLTTNKSGGVPLSRLNQRSCTTTVQAMGKEGAWTSLEDGEDAGSERGILDSGLRTGRASPVGNEGILAVSTVSVTVKTDENEKSSRGDW